MNSFSWKNYKHICDAYRIVDQFGMTLDAQQMWADLYDQYTAYPDGKGNICFENPDNASLFILKYAKKDDNAD